jgi:hypothetical protein
VVCFRFEGLCDDDDDGVVGDIGFDELGGR